MRPRRSAGSPRPARAFLVLLAGAVLASTAYLLVITVTPVLAGRYLSGSGWIGVPNAALVLGVAGGAPLLSWLIPRLGRPSALALGFSVAALACLAPAAAALHGDWFGLYLGGSLLLGAGYAAYHLTRYAAVLLVPPHRSGRAIGLVVWVAVAGSFAAPVIFSWIERFAAVGGGEPIPLAYLAASLLFAGAGLLFFRSRSLRALRSLRTDRAASPGARRTPDSPEEGAGARRRVRLGVVSMAAAHAGMLVVMTMTPVRVVGGGGSLTGLGAIMGAHTLGMFALSPLVGSLCDRFGERPVIAAGGAVLLAAGLLAGLGPGTGAWLGIALYLLGLGWCLAFVAASTLLSTGPDSARKVRRQGLADSLNWMIAAVASVVSGGVMAHFGFPAVSLTGAALGLVPLAAALVMPGEGPAPRRDPRTTGFRGSGPRSPIGGGSHGLRRGSRSRAP